jgi:aminoacylase
MGENEDICVTRFREYIRINTIQPKPDYAAADQFIKNYGEELGLEYSSYECVKGKPCIVLTWKGSDASLGSILLNSHIDVVPVFPEKWDYPPFSAHKTEDGWIYGRGTQDMKCVGIWYMEAIRKLKEEGFNPIRTIHVIWVPDEEIGGHDGMEKLIETDFFKKLNVDFAMDEGLANPGDEYMLYYSERLPWWCEVTVTGQPGHGSQFIPDSVGEKLRKIIDSFMDYRQGQKEKLEKNNLPIGEVTTVNLTMLEGGVQYNVVPDKLKVGFDMRVTPLYDLDEFEREIHSWCKAAAGENYSVRWVQKFEGKNLTSVEPGYKWWDAFDAVMKKFDAKLIKTIFPAATDSRYIRGAGIPALGFSPIKNHPILLHDHNERITEASILEGRNIYQKLIPALANVN